MKNFDNSLEAINYCVRERPKIQLYKAKKFCIKYLAFPFNLEEAQIILADIEDMIKKDIEDDQAMLKGFFRPFFANVIKFLSRFFKEVRSPLSKSYMNVLVELLDDFLIMGSCDRYRIQKKM